LFNLMDYYSASGMPMLFLVFFQTISINWIFGGTRFCDCVEQMTGSKPPVYFYFCWVIFGPLVMAVSWTAVSESYISVRPDQHAHFSLCKSRASSCSSSSSSLSPHTAHTSIPGGLRCWAFSSVWLRCCGFLATPFTTH
jgi:hypothetical protein